MLKVILVTRTYCSAPSGKTMAMASPPWGKSALRDGLIKRSCKLPA